MGVRRDIGGIDLVRPLFTTATAGMAPQATPQPATYLRLHHRCGSLGRIYPRAPNGRNILLLCLLPTATTLVRATPRTISSHQQLTAITQLIPTVGRWDKDNPKIRQVETQEESRLAYLVLSFSSR